MPYSLVDMTLYFFIYSFCGWLMETVLCSIREHRFINRGFLNGPLCPIYGCGILLILTFLLPVRDSIPRAEAAVPVIFLAGAVLASAVEYFTSWAMEKLFHARWWDYSKHRFNLRYSNGISLSSVYLPAEQKDSEFVNFQIKKKERMLLLFYPFGFVSVL